MTKANTEKGQAFLNANKAKAGVKTTASGLQYEVAQDTLDTFVNELGAPKETVPKLKVKSPSTLPQTLTIIEVERS